MKMIKLLESLILIFPTISVSFHLLNKKNAHILQIINAFIFLLLIIILSIVIKSEDLITLGGWPTEFAINLSIDSLSLLFFIVFAISILAISFYCYEEISIYHAKYFYIGAWVVSQGAIFAVSTQDIFNLYVCFEIIFVGSIILLSSNKHNNSNSIFYYLLFNIIGTMLMLFSIGAIYGITGSLNYTSLGDSLIKVPMCLFLISMGIKGGLFPIYYWLPRCYTVANYPALLFLSVLVTKVVFISIIRLFNFLHWESYASFLPIFLLISIMTMFLGVLGAVAQNQIKRILTFHIISQLGYIFLAILANNNLSRIAASYFIIHNIFVKTGLIMISGIITKIYGNSNLNNLGGLIKSNKFLSVSFFIMGLSLAGLPPFSGFWAKLFVLKSALISKFYISTFFAVIVSLMTLFSMMKIWRKAFCDENIILLDKNNFKMTSQKIALSVLVLSMLIISLYPSLIFNFTV